MNRPITLPLWLVALLVLNMLVSSAVGLTSRHGWIGAAVFMASIAVGWMIGVVQSRRPT